MAFAASQNGFAFTGLGVVPISAHAGVTAAVVAEVAVAVAAITAINALYGQGFAAGTGALACGCQQQALGFYRADSVMLFGDSR